MKTMQPKTKTIWVAAHQTATGAVIPALTISPLDETTIVRRPCVWCDATGNGADEENPNYAFFEGSCGNCGGRGWKGTETVADQKRKAFEDAVFYADARRAELMDYDCCPGCGLGGGHDEDPCPGDSRVVTDWFVDPKTGAEVLVMQIQEYVR